MKILLALLASCLSLSAAFPVFIGNSQNYITNAGNNTWYFVITNRIVATYQGDLSIGVNAQQFLADVNILGPLTNTAGGIFGNAGGTFSFVSASGYGKPIYNVSGTGGANTNFTIQATQSLVQVNGGLTNISLTIMGGEAGRAWEGCFVATNFTASDRTLAFSAVSNSWQSVTHFDGVATNGQTLTITNLTAVSVWWRIIGSNVLYAAKHITNPSN